MSWVGSTHFLWAVVCLAVVAWGLRWLIGPEIPPGIDVSGHLQRADFARDELFSHGRFDGWFPGSMLGYQTFLLYGPGLSVLVVGVQALTLGLVSSAGALELVTIAGYAATPFALWRLCRSLGLNREASACAGVLGLAASSYRGGGIEGAFWTALSAQQVAIPLVFLAIAQLLDCLADDPERPARPRRLALTLAAIAVTNPLSVPAFAMFGVVVLVVAAFIGRVDLRRFRGWRSAAVGVAWALGLSAWWWVSMLRHRDLAGVNTAWDLPSVTDHLEMLAKGERGWRGATGPLVVGAVAIGLFFGDTTRRRRLLGLAVMPILALVVLHATHGVWGLHDPVAMQLVNRTLIYVALLATPVAGVVIDAAARRIRPRRIRPVVGKLAWAPVALAIAVVITGQEPPSEYHQRPHPALVTTAEVLAEEVPEGGRFAYVPALGFASGVPETGRWLAWASGRPGLQPFCPECAAGSPAAFAVHEMPTWETIEEWLDRVRRVGVTHVVTEDVHVAGALGSTDQVVLISTAQHLSTWALSEEPDGPVGSVIPADDARTLVAEPERIVVETESDHGADDLVLGLGYSPGWTARIDGRSVDLGRSDDDRLTLDVPEGRHEVELRFAEPATGLIGRLVTLATLIAMLGTRLLLPRRRSHPDDAAPDPADATSPDEAEPTSPDEAEPSSPDTTEPTSADPPGDRTGSGTLARP